METVEDRPVGVALLGLGTVGAGVAKLLLDHPGRLSERSGRQIVLAAVLVKNPDKKRNVDVPPGLFANSLAEILANPNVDIVVELVGGCDWALDAIQQSFAAGKDIVTANKAVLAQHGMPFSQQPGNFSGALPLKGAWEGEFQFWVQCLEGCQLTVQLQFREFSMEQATISCRECAKKA